MREVQLQRMGMTMEEGTITRWLVQPGQPVREGETLLEVETDKVTLQVPAPADGVLGKHRVEENRLVPVGTILCFLLEVGESEETAPEPAPPAALLVTDASVSSVTRVQAADERIRATPRARRLAAELGIDLAALARTDQRITEDDVRAAAEAQATPQDSDVEPVRGIRKLTAERMALSFQTVPHFYLTVECDATNLLGWREDLLADPALAEVRITLTDLFVKLVAQGLVEFPLVNASWTDKGIRRHAQVNIGIATDTPEGLVVPVIKLADKKSIPEIAQARAALITRARTKALLPDDVQGSSFTLTNLGMHRVDAVNAIINPPESAILGIGQVKRRPVVLDDSIVIRPTVVLTLSGDHRVFDGALGARFLARVVEGIENPR